MAKYLQWRIVFTDPSLLSQERLSELIPFAVRIRRVLSRVKQAVGIRPRSR